jgi:hypothetical protein
LFRDQVPSGSVSPWGAGGYDDPEADPVSCPYLCWICDLLTDYVQNVPNWDRYTIVGTNQEVFKDYLRLTTVCFCEHCPDFQLI